MEKISGKIHQVLKQSYANPFSISFDLAKLKESFGEGLMEQEIDILTFIEYCSEVFTEKKSNIFQIFQVFNLSPEDLRKVLFLAINKYFLDIHVQLTAQMINGANVIEIERSKFYKYTNDHGQSISAQFIVELGGDILSKLIQFSYEWEKTISIKKIRKINEINLEELGKLFYLAWINANVIINLERSAFDFVAYENGNVHFRSDGSEIKVETGLKSLHFIKNAGYLRSANNINEWYLQSLPLYEKNRLPRKGIISLKFGEEELEIEWGINKDFTSLANAETEVYVFHPHFINEKLKEFDDFSILDLIEVLVLIQEIVQYINRVNFRDYKERSVSKTPIKIKENHFIDFLESCSGKPRGFVVKVINTLVATSPDYNFWRSPLAKVKDFFLLSFPVLAAPNYSLFIDKWTNVSGYSIQEKELMFKTFVLKEFFEIEETTFQFHHIKAEELNLPPNKFLNNIIIEIADWLLLIEVKMFDFPIEAKEVDEAMHQLSDGVVSLTSKWEVMNETGTQKPIIPIVLTNYNIFSGIVLNDIGIVDLTLFKNYFFVGKYRRTLVAYNSGDPITTDSVVYPYYNNEVEFNKNLVNFLLNPPPVRQITQRFCWKEIQITPVIANRIVYIDNVEHIEESDLLDMQIGQLTHAVNYKYFVNPSEDKRELLDTLITFSLGSIFHQLAYGPYEALSKRVDAYQTLYKTKQIGFAHLVYYINESLPKFNGKKILDKKTFEKYPYCPDKILNVIRDKVGKISGPIRLSEFQFDDEFTIEEEKQIISLALDVLSGLEVRKYTSDEISDLYFPFALLRGLSHKHEVTQELYALFNNFIDVLNFNNKFQAARDLCEEILMLSINKKEPYYGWGLLFKCFTVQKNQFESAIYGCIFLSSLLGLPELPYNLAFEALNHSLKFFRNFGLDMLTKSVYQNLKYFPLSDYDEQSVSLSYFNSLLYGPIYENPNLLDEAINYIEKKQDTVIAFGNQGITPWLFYLYNIKRIVELERIKYVRDYSEILKRLEEESDSNILITIRSMVFGNGRETKFSFIQSLLSIRETRTSRDYIYEIQQLEVVADNLIESSLNPIDFDGMFLAGFVLNDQSLVYNNIYLETGATSSIINPKDEEFEKQINNYSTFITMNIPLKKGQLFIWLFEHRNDVYALTISATKELRLVQLKEWDILLMNQWGGKLHSFYFNCMKRKYYDINEQELDHKRLLGELKFAAIDICEKFDELLVASSVKLSSFPANLLINNSDFIACSKPVSHVISAEWMIKFGHDIELKKNWSSSAWLPIEDGDGTVNWGYDKIFPILKKLGSTIHTSHYPTSRINTDINIFLAHGEIEGTGFKAIYTNDEGESAILYPQEVFGTGTIAVLFICNSGSTKDEIYSNSITSFSMQLLNEGYSTVIAPFWPFDVAISSIWLEEFFFVLNSNLSVSEAVYLANLKVSKYDEATSSCFFAPQGRLAMHLYGNPNIYIHPVK